MGLSGGGYLAAKWMQALKEAERDIVRPGPEDAEAVRLLPSEIDVLPELFQPREIPSRPRGSGYIDKKYTKQLQREIAKVGELDPVVVIKLKKTLTNPYLKSDTTPVNQWIIVDGHHRLEAYLKDGWGEPIECQWFRGTAREATDISVKLNSKIKLPMSMQNKQDAAWKRVLLNDCSIAQIATTCGVGKTMVKFMRRVRARYYDRTDRSSFTKRFREEVRPIEECAWTFARMAYINKDKTERTKDQKAETLAKRMRTALEGRLSKDAEVTAMALVKYDPELATALLKELPKATDALLSPDGETLAAELPDELPDEGDDERREEVARRLQEDQARVRAEGFKAARNTPEWTFAAIGQGRSPVSTKEGGRGDQGAA
jgi:hypothetical protein